MEYALIPRDKNRYGYYLYKNSEFGEFIVGIHISGFGEEIYFFSDDGEYIISYDLDFEFYSKMDDEEVFPLHLKYYKGRKTCHTLDVKFSELEKIEINKDSKLYKKIHEAYC